jgi:hypothetical protein
MTKLFGGPLDGGEIDCKLYPFMVFACRSEGEETGLYALYEFNNGKLEYVKCKTTESLQET